MTHQSSSVTNVPNFFDQRSTSVATCWSIPTLDPMFATSAKLLSAHQVTSLPMCRLSIDYLSLLLEKQPKRRSYEKQRRIIKGRRKVEKKRRDTSRLLAFV